MIEANELRIGNWIYNPLQKIPFKVDFTALSNVYYDNKLDKPRYEPIPITEEILLKCGIDEEYEIVIKAKRKKIVFYWGSRVVATGKRQGFYCLKYPHIKHLHQLQNLYFALTGEELNVEL